MDYWNKDNFEGLKSVGEKYSAVEGYELFGKYCLQKEKGLKKLAVSSIKEFVTVSKSKSLKVQREIAEELSSLGVWNSEIHQLLAHPLVEFLKSVLEQWTLDEPSNPIPHKWLGYIGGDLSSYERALEIDPTDEICISRIAQAHLNDVDYQTHHLSESLFLGDIRDATNSLQLVASLIDRLTTKHVRLKMRGELEYYNNLLSCWMEYSELGIDEPFADWCVSKGEKFNFWSIAYYRQ
ncbi:hypothetical protein GCM10007938_29920 [Vibrio zhanjiangensis]|uniref:DUF1266 domain-containing protein n=1 Tax=Vibrio zhanjiangensis TaxID=1046128 RepID=A0ABQ6F182_9VIBR|nr:hypothetical protein [Vibrio zhanjiangensis]GLT19210.1 hypothetical protein GCM10007938_29920 [Vibrio zhanjiangensis]